MNRGALFIMTSALALSAVPASAQTTQIDPPAAVQTKPDDATNGMRQSDQPDRSNETRVNEGRVGGNADDTPANPPERDETVGVGGSVDRAPRDIREPFDE